MAVECTSCGEGRVVTDPDSGARVCDSCGCVLATDEFRHQEFTADGVATSRLAHSTTYFTHRARVERQASGIVSEICTRLGLSSSRAAEALQLASDATDGSLGSGDWFPVLAAASAYVVARRHGLPVSLPLVADAAGRLPRDVGRMASRLTQYLDLPQLPLADPALALDAAIRTAPSFRDLDHHKVDQIVAQGKFLIQCATRWCLTTGRQPLPVVAAVITLVAEANKVEVSIEDIAVEIHAGVSTTRTRYKELVETLMRVARVLLPWGQDVTPKNLIQNAPLLIRMMQMKSKSQPDSEHEGVEALGVFDLQGFVDSYSDPTEENREESKYYKTMAGGDGEELGGIGGDDLEKLKLSAETLSQAYKKALHSVAQVNQWRDFGTGNTKKKRRGSALDVEAWLDSSKGRWDFDKNLTLDEVLERDVGYDALPPSFVSGVESRRRRRVKIEEAKRRIKAIKKPLACSDNVSPAVEDPCQENLVMRKRKRKGDGEGGIGWEDCIIELLLLHDAPEEEIEHGQYNRLLDLHVFNSFSVQS